MTSHGPLLASQCDAGGASSSSALSGLRDAADQKPADQHLVEHGLFLPPRTLLMRLPGSGIPYVGPEFLPRAAEVTPEERSS